MRFNLSPQHRREMRQASIAAALSSLSTFFTGQGAGKRVAFFAWEVFTTGFIWLAGMLGIAVIGAELGLIDGVKEGTIPEVAINALLGYPLWKYAALAAGIALALRLSDIVVPATNKAKETYLSTLARNTK